MVHLQVKRRVRFSLGCLFGTVFVLCVILGMKVNHVTQQKKAIAWIYAADGEIQFDYEVTHHGVPVPGRQPPGPQWLHSLVGVDYFRTPYCVVLREVTDLSPLTDLTGLRELSVGRSEVTDLSPLAKLTKLRSLTVCSDQLSDVSALERLCNLESLALVSQQVIDLHPVAGLSNLERLCLSSNQRTDLSPLRSLTGLKELFIDISLGTDEQLATLKEALPNCTIVRAPIEFQ